MSNNSPCTLRERLERDNEVIQTIIDSVPPKYFFDHDVWDQLEDVKVRTGDQECKGLMANVRNKFGVKAKHKRYRLNPLHKKTVSQIVQDLDRMDKGAQSLIAKPLRNNIEDLQERLRKKIQIMQEKRQGPGNRETIQTKRNVEKLTKNQKRRKKKSHIKGNASLSGKMIEVKQKSPQAPALFNKEGKLIYSKFDLGSSVTMNEKPKGLKETLKRSMKQVEQKQEKLSKLEEQSPERASELKKKEVWKQALRKSEGVKVKDNAELLKKSLKKREQHKKKSQKQWETRTEHVQKKQQERQEKRTKNIQDRKNSKLNKKLKKASKKGRLIPGF